MAGGTIGTNGSGKEYPGKLTPRVVFVCVIAAFGGLIFGYDLGISGIHINSLFKFSLCFCVLFTY